MNDFRIYNNCIYHHGIKGQKWGVRNGPPYPLDASDHSAAEKKAAKGGSKKLSTSTSDISKKRVGSLPVETGKKQFDREKALKVLKYAAIGATAVAGAAILYNVAKHYDISNMIDYYTKGAKNDEFSSKLESFLLAGMGYIDGDKIMDSFVKKNVTDKHLKLENIKKLSNKENPLKSMIKTNFGYPVPGRTMNCTFCTAAMAMRQKGYDVQARVTPGGFKPQDVFDRFFKDAHTETSSVKTFIDDLTKQGPGAYGNLTVYWKTGGGHSLFYKINDKGSLKIYDGQSGLPVIAPLLKSLINDMPEFDVTTNFCRLDKSDPINDILAIVQPK